MFGINRMKAHIEETVTEELRAPSRQWVEFLLDWVLAPPPATEAAIRIVMVGFIIAGLVMVST